MGKFNYYKWCILGKSLCKWSPYVQYKMNNKNIYNEFSYYNFWYGMDIKNFWMAHFIKHNKLNTNNKKINFVSVFGNRKVLKYIDGIKIFYTGEYVGKDRFADYDDYCLNDVDLSIGFREYEGIKNYIRLPLRISYLFDPTKTSIEDIQGVLDELENRKNGVAQRKKFCALISSHDDIENTRTNAFNIVSKYGQVDCPGKLLHNIDANIPKYQDKIDFLGNYKYNICPENKEDKGYVTEKIIDSYKAGCIPIYKGMFGELEKNIFNKDCIIWLNNINTSTFSYNKEKSFMENKIFKKGSSEYIYEIIENLKEKFKHVLM